MAETCCKNSKIIQFVNTQIFVSISNDNVTGFKTQNDTYSHEVLARSLGSVALGLESSPLLVDGPLNAVVKVPSLGDLPVLLALASQLGLRKTTLQMLLGVPQNLGLLHAVLNLHSFIGRQLMDVVRGLAVTVQRLLTNSEVGLVQGRPFQSLLRGDLQTVRLNLGTPGSAQVHVQVGQKSLLDVGNFDGLILGHKEGLNDTAPQVHLERSFQVFHEPARNGFFPLLTGLGLLDAIEGQELGVVELDQKAVVTLGLDANDGGQTEAGFLVVADLREAEINLGFEAVDILALGGPSVVMGGVAESSTN